MTLVAVPDPGWRGFYALVAGCGQCSFSVPFLFLLSGLYFFRLFASFSSSACTSTEANQAEGKINRQITSVRRRRRRLDEYFCCSFWAVRFFVFFALLSSFCFCFLLSLVYCLPSQLLFVAALVLHCLLTEPLCPTKWQPNDSSGLDSESKRER